MQVQGQTIRHPTAVVVDFYQANFKAMVYVMLSRAQTIDQIHIMGSLYRDVAGWRPDMSALEELESSINKAINTAEEIEVDKEVYEFKILCLNVDRLKKHFDDVARTVQAASSPSAICLQETWLNEGDDVERYQLQNLKLNLNSVGNGRGLATYFNEKFKVTDSLNTASCQMTRISSKKIDVINVYKSKECSLDEFARMLFKIIDDVEKSKELILCGDFNIHFSEETSNNFISKIISEYSFDQLVKVPTHDRGNIIDHVYVSPGLKGRVMVDKTCVYHSDHDLLTIKVSADDEVD